MDPIRNILVIVDPTATEHAAVVKGAALAETFDARLDHQDDRPRLLDRCILEQASALANRAAGELHMAHAYVPKAFNAGVGAMSTMAMDVAADSLEMERRAKLTELHAMASDYHIPQSNDHLRAGSTSDVLCRLATELDIDVMAMGAVSRSALKRVFIGSTAEGVLERLPCDLWIVKAPNFSELLAL